jgi:hypothetical protein
MLREVAVTEGEPGPAVRRLATRAIGLALRPRGEPVRIVGRPPVAVGATGPLDLVVSLSHHGRFVAFAAERGSRALRGGGRRRDIPDSLFGISKRFVV